MNGGKLVFEQVVDSMNQGSSIGSPRKAEGWLGSFSQNLASSVPLLLADVGAVFVAWIIVKCICFFLFGITIAPGFKSIVAVGLVYPMMLYGSGLYPGLVIAPDEELRRVFVASAFSFSAFIIASYLYHDFSLSHLPIRVLNFSLLFLIGGLTRIVVRGCLRSSSWWKQPVVVFGRPEDRKKVIAWLHQNGHFGLAAAGPVGSHSNAILASQTARDDEKIFRFRNLWHVEYFGSRPKVTRHQKNLLLSPLHALCKRAFDLAVVVTAIPLIAPVMLVLAVLVKLSSPGPIFYSQSRTGKNGKPFRAFKFRSMVPNADDVLEQYLSANDDMRLEWERDHKLKRDPRVTNVGRFMRKTSLDELPQLFNVIIGDMSLVGPRPIVTKEIEKYADRYICYQAVAPGITGLWQINGRNNTTYEERTAFDENYACNWSVWFDLYILIRTVKTVLRCEGAY